MGSLIPSISLFSGAGGLDIGARIAGFQSKVAVESDATACSTLHLNACIDGKIFQADIRDISGEQILSVAGLGRGEVPLLLGGPPCQSFSKAAYWASSGDEAKRRRARDGRRDVVSRSVRVSKRRDPKSDERTSLLDEYLRLLDEMRPQHFVFENVPSLRHPTNRPFFERFVARCHALKYNVDVHLLNAAEYGVAQLRQRLFIVGASDRHIESATPTHYLPGRRVPKLKPPVGSAKAISRFASDRYSEKNEVPDGRWSAALKSVPPGQNYKALTAWAGHPKPLFVAESRFWNFLLKLHPDQPSWTIAANPGPWVGPFHWSNRRLRVPELAALQGFPRDYVFEGSPRETRRQIGNAVPPPMAAAVIAKIRERYRV